MGSLICMGWINKLNFSSISLPLVGNILSTVQPIPQHTVVILFYNLAMYCSFSKNVFGKTSIHTAVTYLRHLYVAKYEA